MAAPNTSAKRAAESPEERAAREAATREKLRRKVHLSGRKPSAQNKQFKSGYRPSRSKNLSVTDIKKLFLDGTETAVKEIWKIMRHSRSEALRLAASQLWLNRSLGKVPSGDITNIGQVIFRVETRRPMMMIG